jgi:hypothetical protein
LENTSHVETGFFSIYFTKLILFNALPFTKHISLFINKICKLERNLLIFVPYRWVEGVAGSFEMLVSTELHSIAFQKIIILNVLWIHRFTSWMLHVKPTRMFASLKYAEKCGRWMWSPFRVRIHICGDLNYARYYIQIISGWNHSQYQLS